MKNFSKKILTALCIPIILGMVAYYFPIPPVKASFTHYIQITTKHAQVPNSNQTNFPVLFATTTLTSLKTVGNGGEVQNANGYDIGYYTNSNCSTGKMTWENEKYVASTGERVDWVLITTLHTGSDDTFYMCWGDASISTDQSNKTAVWDSNFKEVYHMADTITASVGTSTDSTISANNMTLPGTNNCCGGTPNIATATGQIGTAINFINGNEYSASTANSVSNSGIGTGVNLTLESWINMSGSGGYDSGYNDYLGIAGANSEVGLSTDNSNVAFGMTNADGTLRSTPFINGSSTGVWQHIVGTYDGTTQKVYINGAFATSSTITVARTNDGVVKVGGNNDFFLGFRSTGIKMDEVRVSNSVRSADWIATEYNNTSNNPNFFTVGAEQNIATTVSYHGQVIINKSQTVIKGQVIIN